MGSGAVVKGGSRRVWWLLGRQPCFLFGRTVLKLSLDSRPPADIGRKRKVEKEGRLLLARLGPAMAGRGHVEAMLKDQVDFF